MLTTSRILQFLLLAAFVAAGSGAFGAQKSDKPLYKWVDEKGIVHYGDSIPPQYAKQERSILNKHGIEVGRLDAEKTDAQRAADAVRNQVIAIAKQRDQVLLTTYISVEQIEQLRDQRLELIEGQVKVTAQYLETLNGRLQDLQSRALFFQPYSSNEGAGPMPDALAEDLVRTIKEIRLQERNLASKRAEQSALREHFQSDIERYAQLRSPSPSSKN